ncbi:uncharacterized protein [Clytia hemisphaerica]|uniref:uncharacterized protein n=1 Tax=Clytia hemisphaerica TaxID=252671 RepID=UPI0034D3CA96
MHIPHIYTQEMSQKSEVVPLGLIFKDETSTSGMIDIVKHIQENYVPQVTLEDGTIEVIKQIAVGGDQKTEGRCDSAQRCFLDGRNDFEKLQGVWSKFEHWHLKRTLYILKETLFQKSSSGSQYGTTQWSLNVTNMTNAKSGPKKAFNAYKDFSDVELDSQIVACAMVHFDMKNIDDDPVPQEIKDSEDPKERFLWLYNNIEEILTKFTIKYSDGLQRAQKEETREGTVPILHMYLCYKNKTGECSKKGYKKAKGRNEHEKKKHNYDRSKWETKRLDYQKALLSFNLLLRNINDSIREGDGERLMENYKVAMLYFKAHGHKNYALSLLKYFYTIKHKSEFAHELLWEGFVNNKGYPGRNISLDLHLEHLNNFLKELLKNLRSNLTKNNNAERVSKALNNIKLMVDNTEKMLDVKKQESGSRKFKSEDTVRHLASELHKNNPFKESYETYESFKNFNGQILQKLDCTAFMEWMVTKRKEFFALNKLNPKK